jgi:hypothetical protein
VRRLCVLLLVCLATTASAGPARIVVATTDRALISALADALAPVGMTIVEVADAPPAAIGELATSSRTIAEREHAGAVVWLLVDPEGATLVAYDREIDRVLVRPLKYAPPLSPERAAETARAARTMLRALKLADEPERQPEPQPPPIIVVEQPPELPLAPRPWPNVTMVAGFGGRYGRLGEDGVIEGQLAAIVRPDAFGVMAMVSLSPRASLSNPAFMGDVSDNSIAIAARMPLRIAPRIWVAGYAGPAMHAVEIEGTLGAEAVSELRFDLALRAGATATYGLSDRFDVGLGLSMDTMLRRQRYEVPGGQVLVMPRLQVSVGLMFAMRVM